MKKHTKTAIVAFVMFAAGLSIGAVRPASEYDRACQNMLAEKEAFTAFVIAQKYGARKQPVDEATMRATAERLNHWLTIMEQFKP